MKELDQITDYKEAAEILNAEFATLGWHRSAAGGWHRSAAGGPTLEEDETGWKHYRWAVTFAPPSAKPETFAWRVGVGHVVKSGPFKGRPVAPNLAEVLGRCCDDYQSTRNEGFEGWAENFGMDTDSRKALRMYDECAAIGGRLRRLGLTNAQIERFAALASML